MADYTVQLRLGGYSWTIDQGDVPDPDAVVVLDGLTMGWRFSDEDWPGAQLEPMTAALGLLVDDVALLANLGTGALASVRLLSSTGDPVGGVYGRIGELTADQVRRPNGAIWTRYAVTIVDHSAATEPITATFAASTPGDRFDAILAAAETKVRYPPVADDIGVQLLAAQDVSEAALVDVLRAHMRDLTTFPNSHYLFWGGGDFDFQLVVPVADFATGELAILSILYLYDPNSEALPGTLALVGHELQLVAADDGAGGRDPHAIPGDRVELQSGQWRQGQEGTADSVTVRKPDGTAVTRYATGVTKRTTTNRRTIETQLTQDSWAKTLGDAYLPDAPVIRGWDRDGFVWRVEDPVELGAPGTWFPDFTNEEYEPGFVRYSDSEMQLPEAAPYCLAGTFAVFGLRDDANLAGAANHYGGRLKYVTLQLDRGRLSVNFAIRRQLRRAIDELAIANVTPAWLRANFPTVALRVGVDIVDPGITIRDLRIARQV